MTIMTKRFYEGQLVEVSWTKDKDDTGWAFYVVEYIFDDRIKLIGENGREFMYVVTQSESTAEEELLKNQPTKFITTPLFKDGKPVMSGKTWRGKYTFKPSRG